MSWLVVHRIGDIGVLQQGVRAADVVDGLVVEHDGDVGVLQQGVRAVSWPTVSWPTVLWPLGYRFVPSAYSRSRPTHGGLLGDLH